VDLHLGSAEDDVLVGGIDTVVFREPLQLLENFYRMLRPGGVLWLETPNLASDGHRRYGRHWLGLDPPRHLVLFTSETLRRALLDTGFSNPRAHWHGLCVFDIFAASRNAREGRQIWSDTAKFSFSLEALWCECVQMFAGSRREFATFTAVKPGAT
jgi:SAM-dependent methyltransferase